MGKSFPSDNVKNLGFYCVGMGSAVPFSVLAVDALPNLHLTGAGSGGQFYSRYTYVTHEEPAEDLFSQLAESPEQNTDSAFERVDNVTDWALADYRSSYEQRVTKDDIFYFTYGLLHSPHYRTEFASDLTKMLPRIPKLADAADFRDFATAGRDLAALHIGYRESVPPYPLEEVCTTGVTDSFRVEKMAFGKNKDRSRIVFNKDITLVGIPEDAYHYMIGSRSAIQRLDHGAVSDQA